MDAPNRLGVTLKALRQLGPRPLFLYAYHSLALRSGLLRLRLPAHQWAKVSSRNQHYRLAQDALTLPERSRLAATVGEMAQAALAEADEIVAGQVRLFGGSAQKLELVPPQPLEHWTAYRHNQVDGRDIKLLWEPARFGWATKLARAYALSSDERYAEAFWDYTETFLAANPPNQGPNWVSAQEAALRLIALFFAYQVFSTSRTSTVQRRASLGAALEAHALRIPPTLAYARAQNNNHLLLEAAGLYTAGIALPEHPRAARWRSLGWRWFNRALGSQIAPDGTYVQHSSNYHRLMLSAALWVATLAKGQGQELPKRSCQRLAAASNWLLALLDEDSGRVPNLGANDGAYLLPLTITPFHDYRPIIQAAGQTFLGARPLPPGPWDELGLWLNGEDSNGVQSKAPPRTILTGNHSWAYLRAAHFTDRPSHADQLHLDLWWRGLNVALDAGTYLYNGDPPWDNCLADTRAHNTLTVNGEEQMTRAGRFLWLDWAQAKVVERREDGDGKVVSLVAEHDGYRRLGVVHRRTVEVSDGDQWTVADTLLPAKAASDRVYTAHLHWLLPDWPWELDGSTLRVNSPHGWVELAVSLPEKTEGEPQIQLSRAGELLKGDGPIYPTRGWYSPTYNHKIPALSFSVEVTGRTPLTLVSRWRFPG